MIRIPEPELMDDPQQAKAYAEADFSVPHNHFIELFLETFQGHEINGYALDLGCGPGDITLRFARVFPDCTIHGLDGSEAMLAEGHRMMFRAEDVDSRIQLLHGFLPGTILPRNHYDIIISNSLLHHLQDPYVLWEAIEKYGRSGTKVFIMDLMRPADKTKARTLMETYAAGEPEILQQDFYHSLLAAFVVEEVEKQLEVTGLGHLSVKKVSDRHCTISGFLP